MASLVIEHMILGFWWYDPGAEDTFWLELHCSYDAYGETVTLDEVTSPDGQHAVDDCPDDEIEWWREALEEALNQMSAENFS